MALSANAQRYLHFLQRHERHLSTVALILGAIFDWLTITKPDSLFGSISLAAYLTVAAGGILLLNARKAREKESIWLPPIIQFCFGNLASGLLVLYSQSATIVGSWLYLLVLGGFLIGNEFARERYARLRSHVIGFYVLLCAYGAFLVPVILKAIGWKIFLLSSALCLSVMLGYVLLLLSVAPSRVKGDWKGTVIGLLAVTGVFNGLYFLNFIPPIPLSLTSVGVYQGVTWAGDRYVLEGEAQPNFWDVRAYLRPIVHVPKGYGAYCFSEVYAPVGLSTPIYHEWEYYNEKEGAWESRLRISFEIHGGRQSGFRGYSYKSNLMPGTWRCLVETEEGALIGRSTFSVVAGQPSLQTTYR